jgi:hypothetical protein
VRLGFLFYAFVVELVDTLLLGSSPEMGAGSSPVKGTMAPVMKLVVHDRLKICCLGVEVRILSGAHKEGW